MRIFFVHRIDIIVGSSQKSDNNNNNNNNQNTNPKAATAPNQLKILHLHSPIKTEH